jgi:hypothetical protein
MEKRHMATDLGIDRLAVFLAGEMKLGHVPINYAAPTVGQIILDPAFAIRLEQADVVLPNGNGCFNVKHSILLWCDDEEDENKSVGCE